MIARLDGGWLRVCPYLGPDLAPCFITTGNRGPGGWLPAFKGWAGHERVLQVRPPAGAGPVRVWVKIGGQVTEAGQVNLGGQP